MHFFYIDETWCTWNDLESTNQPIFVSWWIILSDKWWNKTHSEFIEIISNYFSWNIPDNFELHTQELFSNNWSWFFEWHTRNRRNELINNILDLIISRKHHCCYLWIDKNKLNDFDISNISIKNYMNLKIPYIISYDYLITTYEKYTKEKLWKSARALIIIDKKDDFIREIEEITNHRRFKVSNSKRIKWIAEFSYPVDSKKNTMIQISDLIIYLSRKFLEIEHWYKDSYPSDVKEIFRNFYKKIDSRIITVWRTLNLEDWRWSTEYNDFLNEISLQPKRWWKTRRY